MKSFRANPNDVTENFAVVMSAVLKRVDCSIFVKSRVERVHLKSMALGLYNIYTQCTGIKSWKNTLVIDNKSIRKKILEEWLS